MEFSTIWDLPRASILETQQEKPKGKKRFKPIFDPCRTPGLLGTLLPFLDRTRGILMAFAKFHPFRFLIFSLNPVWLTV